jgi:hypothetical protein
MGEKPARDDVPFHVFVADDGIATRQEGISANENANFHGHVDLFISTYILFINQI